MNDTPLRILGALLALVSVVSNTFVGGELGAQVAMTSIEVWWPLALLCMVLWGLTILGLMIMILGKNLFKRRNATSPNTTP